VGGRQPFERVAGDRAADASRRHGGAQRLAHDQLLAMRLGELVRVMRADPSRASVDQRHDRKLDEIVALDQPIEHAELGRVDDVLGVVQHHRLEPAAERGLVGAHRIP